MDYEIPDWMIEAYKKIGIFGFGVVVTQLTTDIAKYSIGRLRPHFLAVCQPIMPDGSTCADAINRNKYIMDFRCQALGSTERMLKEARLSFPSGHSSFSFFTMVYLAMYLQSRMTWQGSKLFRHFLQFCFIMIAWYTALSRVSDYKHHWSDVLAGTIIGSLIAIVVKEIGFPILFFFLWGDPYKRGFFCDDESLMHPFKDSTIKSWMLYVIGLLIPIGVILLVEILQAQHNEKLSNGNSTSRRYVFMDYEIPDWMIEAYKKIGIFGFGVVVTQLTTDIAKYSIGRLRPHFLARYLMPDNWFNLDTVWLNKTQEQDKDE
uniref:Phosphatidic acid phosphatase type 2/haloperoxidase domain-containing protein n=1 Tax=Glossina brevipalpis TaxID=37001 RepID=A0A1A9WIZ7_9MUSC